MITKPENLSAARPELSHPAGHNGVASQIGRFGRNQVLDYGVDESDHRGQKSPGQQHLDKPPAR